MWAIVGWGNEVHTVVYDLREGFFNIKSTAPTEKYETALMWAIVGQANEVVYDLMGGFLNNKSCLGRHKANISHDCTECEYCSRGYSQKPEICGWLSVMARAAVAGLNPASGKFYKL